MQTDRLLRTKHLQELFGVSRTTIWRLVQEGVLPRPRKLSERGRCSVWRESDVRAVLEKTFEG